MAGNVSAVPEPGHGVVGVFDEGRTGWVEGSAATEARNGLLNDVVRLGWLGFGGFAYLNRGSDKIPGS